MRLVAAFLIVACSGSSTNPIAPAEPPRPVVWQTEPQPWHLPRPLVGVGASAEVAMVGGLDGWVTKIELRTGKVIREKRIAEGGPSIYDIAHLGDDRWIAVGSKAYMTEEVVAYTFDGATLESTKVELPSRVAGTDLVTPKVAVTPQGVVITGRGLPLAVYDPVTWRVKTMLDTQLGWFGLSAHGSSIIANMGSKTHRFDLATGTRRVVGEHYARNAIGDGIEVLGKVEPGGITVTTIHADGNILGTLPDRVKRVAVDASGKRLVSATDTAVRVHALPSGAILKSYPLGPGGFGENETLVLAGSRVLTESLGVLRAVDLDAGTQSPNDGPTRPLGIAVDFDGTVLLASSTSVVRMQHGKVLATESLEKTRFETMRSDDTRRYVVSVSDRDRVHLRVFGSPTPLQTWQLEFGGFEAVTLASGDAVVFDFQVAGIRRLTRTNGAALMKAYSERFADAVAIALDPDGDALIAREGRVAVIGSNGTSKATLRVPDFDETAAGALEPGGSRAVTYGERGLALWDRTSAKLLGSVAVAHVTDVLFLPKRNEIVLVHDDRVQFWVPGASMRSLPLAGVQASALSKDGKRLALAFHDGHVAVYDVDRALASATTVPLPATALLPATCANRDPLEIPSDQDTR